MEAHTADVTAMLQLQDGRHLPRTLRCLLLNLASAALVPLLLPCSRCHLPPLPPLRVLLL